MKLKAIIDKCSMLSAYEVRHITDDYGELVVYNSKMAEWDRVLSDSLGPPKKPAGVEPSEDDLRVTENYGGIWINQTLFKKEFEDHTLIAMYWPWQDNTHTTVRLARLRKSITEPASSVD